MILQKIKRKICKLLIVVCLLFPLTNFSQPFTEEIEAFKQEDRISLPPKDAILFVGSSSFRMWDNVQAYFPSHKIINRGFGGSTLVDVIQYANDIIVPYKPKQVVIYCGENDLASSDSITAEMVYERFITLFDIIRNELGEKTTVTFISVKPSPSRAHLMVKMERANELIKDFLSTQPNTSFVDVYHLMLDESQRPLPEIFRDDSLHMNPKGYAIWQKAIEPHLAE